MYRAVGIGQDDYILDDSTPQGKDYCENLPAGACAVSQEVLEYARAQCPGVPRVRGFDTYRGGGLRGLIQGFGKVCSVYSKEISMGTAHWWNPCVLKSLPLCVPKPPPFVTEEPVPVVPTSTPDLPTYEPQEEPPPEVVEEDEGRQYVVGGLLALVVAGGVGYAVWRNRKKRGKRRKR